VIEDLADQKKMSGSDYSLYREALNSGLIQSIPGFNNDKSGFDWSDLLAWLARDQEARYETLWKWRDREATAKQRRCLKHPR